jgi:uncharacterized protein involved in response to NO
MAEILHITDAASSAARPPQWSAFLALGFRPLYLAGCCWAAVSIALWIFLPQALAGSLSGIAWHAHEMLWGFVATIAVGFLLTAGSNWTAINPLHGRALGGLCVLWLLARTGFLLPGTTVFRFAAVCELLFFLLPALALGRAVWLARNRRNYGLPLIMLTLAIADGLYLVAALQGDYALLMQRFNTGLLCMAVIALLIARRVIPFFAMRVIDRLEIPLQVRSGHWQIGAGVLAIVFELLGMPQLTAAALAITGAIALVHVISWKPWAVRRKPLLWILYAGYAALGIGLLVAAAHTAGWIVRGAWPVHVIGVGGFSVLIIGMVTRTALGHLGRPLQTDRSMLISYVLVLTAAALRLLALLPTAFSPAALHASATLWIVAFALYLWRFFPLMVRPRIN